MKNTKDSSNLSVSAQLQGGEKLGAQVAKIMNIARVKCNKLLQPLGYGVNFQADFYKLEPKQEVKDV